MITEATLTIKQVKVANMTLVNVTKFYESFFPQEFKLSKIFQRRNWYGQITLERVKPTDCHQVPQKWPKLFHQDQIKLSKKEKGTIACFVATEI